MKNDISPALLRIGHAARISGLSPDLFEAASHAGAIPVRIIQLGPRSRYVSADEFNAWLKSIKPVSTID
ncbi:MAG TPA: hypothetical protein PLE55_11295 [Clostridiales bacterium]|nr:hypothetical protein [Clostridiales bacterium]